MELISVFKITDQNMIGKDKYLSVSEEKSKIFEKNTLKTKNSISELLSAEKKTTQATIEISL